MSRRRPGLADAQRPSGGLLDAPAEADLTAGMPASDVASDLPDDLLYGSPSPHHDPPPRDCAPSGAPSRGGWFSDPTAEVDEHGRSVGCRSCGTPLSQPRIDYGLTTCPVHRPAPSPATPEAIAAVRR